MFLNFFPYFPRNNTFDVGVYDNFSSNYNRINAEFFSMSNHLHDRPYPKTKIGEKLFETIVNKLNHVDTKQELIEKLFEMAKYDAGYLKLSFLFFMKIQKYFR